MLGSFPVESNNEASANRIVRIKPVTNADAYQLNQIDNSHLQQWIDKIEQLFHHNNNFEVRESTSIYSNNTPENILTSITHQDQLLLHEHLQQIFTKIIQDNFTLFKIILEEYPALIRLLDTIISLSFPNLLIVVMRPVLNHLYLLLYKSIVETGDFSDKPKIINKCLNLLGKCVQVSTNFGHNTTITEVLFEFEKNLPDTSKHAMEQYLEQTILEKCYDIKINNRSWSTSRIKNYHVSFLRSCLCFAKLSIFGHPSCHNAMKQYISMFIDNVDWSTSQDNEMLTLAHELTSISEKDEEFVSLTQKAKITSVNMTLLSELFTELLTSMLKQPFKSVYNFKEYRIIAECIRTNASTCIILENFIENLFLECNNNFRILNAAHEIFLHITLTSTKGMLLNELDNGYFSHLVEDVSIHWIRHQFKHYDWFLRSMIFAFSHVMDQEKQHSSNNQQSENTSIKFSQTLIYMTRYIFAHDLSKDLELAQDSLLHIIQTLSQCKNFDRSQYLSFIEEESEDENHAFSFQPFPIHSLIHLYLTMTFVRYDSKNFTYDQVIDFFLLEENDFARFTEKTLIILRWMDQMIILLNSSNTDDHTVGKLSFNHLQLLLLLGYLRILTLFKKKCHKIDNNMNFSRHLSSLILKFHEEYYEPLCLLWKNPKTSNQNNHTQGPFMTSFSQRQKESQITTTSTTQQQQTWNPLGVHRESGIQNHHLTKHQTLMIPLIISTFERISLYDEDVDETDVLSA
ncbi:hypothetical protein C9374_006827 [Naegleria lovaniensis]|uniref:Uncharacterized protein n=1 Tax=Naegleria lovaniensis TaxID=51637 RepID=A0AA88H5V8_NAELO|nr:uncharacterized protein C9374_006827 [Naegleria lovaniensis]KAG2393296.1 hypothetical protein C9374_006827 [Naegleria lovaniensis]